MALTEQQKYDATYLAKVIADGRMVGADWLTIATRLVDVDLPGMGFARGKGKPLNRHGMTEHAFEGKRA